MSEHEPLIQDMSICFRPAQGMMPFNVHGGQRAIVDMPLQQGLSIESIPFQLFIAVGFDSRPETELFEF